jgi:hypothetical protein
LKKASPILPPSPRHHLDGIAEDTTGGNQHCSEAPTCLASKGRKRCPYLGRSSAPSSTPATAPATGDRRRGRAPPRIARSGLNLDNISWHRAKTRQVVGNSLH